jgi:hypothetical protein
MAKRAAPTDPLSPSSKAQRGSQGRVGAQANEIGEFEDQWEDDLEDDEQEIVDGDGMCVHSYTTFFYRHKYMLSSHAS